MGITPRSVIPAEFRVALVGRRKDHIEKVAREIGDRAFAIAADIFPDGRD